MRRDGPPFALAPEGGFSLIELLCGLAVTLVVASGAYAFLTSAERVASRQTAQASSLGDAILALDLVASAARSAGYDPLGIGFLPVPLAAADRVTFAADLDGDGRVQPASAGDERVTFGFEEQDKDGVRLVRIIDLNGDGDGTDTGERQEEIASDLVAIDGDGNGTTDPFFSYDSTTRLVRVAFGVRIRGTGATGAGTLVPFQAAFRVRNGLGLPEVTCIEPAS